MKLRFFVDRCRREDRNCVLEKASEFGVVDRSSIVHSDHLGFEFTLDVPDGHHERPELSHICNMLNKSGVGHGKGEFSSCILKVIEEEHQTQGGDDVLCAAE